MTRLSNGEKPVKVKTEKPSPIKGMRVLIIVWGETHYRYMREALIPSLCQPKNLEALQGAVIELYSDKEVELGIDLPVHWNRIALNGERAGEVQQKILIDVLRRTAQTGDRVLLAPPDTFFGEGTIPNLLAVNDPGTAVAFPHARVIDTEFLSALERLPDVWPGPGEIFYYDTHTGGPFLGGPFWPVSNPRLVSIASECFHRSFSDSIDGNNSFYSGVFMRKVGNMWIVHHRIPTPYLVHPMKCDADLLGSYGVQGAWDHRWPEHLVKQGRWRVVGSSDLCFAVELTPEDKNIPPITPVSAREPDRYRGKLDHHNENRSFLSVWRCG